MRYCFVNVILMLEENALIPGLNSEKPETARAV
jgi:hypothetical protein